VGVVGVAPQLLEQVVDPHRETPPRGHQQELTWFAQRLTPHKKHAEFSHVRSNQSLASRNSALVTNCRQLHLALYFPQYLALGTAAWGKPNASESGPVNEVGLAGPWQRTMSEPHGEERTVR
jgi:hypothetical protein